ncbi:MAG TPA: electron transfer flavoprotein subunit beta/FixA family protein [Ignavibacteria bacterium]|nr:electron transfer flavoprotein subunit beta/FixA family protein [Ignavibacteria bacterium]
MKIIVCVALVPDSTTKVKVSDSKISIDEAGVSYILNPYDEFAVEEALRLKEKNGGEVISISFGSDKSKEAIKKSFQMGADKGVFIKSGSENYDSFTVAKNLADYIKSQNPDIVLFGKQSIDYDGSIVPSMVSELLNLPCINVVVKMEIADGKITAEREIEGGKEIIESSLPIVIGAQKGLNEPRYPNLKSIMAAKSKPIEEIAATYNGNKVDIIEMNLPPAKASGKIFMNGKDDVAELIKLLREEAKVI